MVGFFYLIDVDFDFENIFNLSNRFFNLNKEEKQKLNIKNNKYLLLIQINLGNLEDIHLSGKKQHSEYLIKK